MKITEITLTKKINGIEAFKMSGLGDVVVLAGSNGSGKSRLLKLLTKRIELSQLSEDEWTALNDEDKELLEHMKLSFKDKSGNVLQERSKCISLINYSHYDIPLQSPAPFSPYVVSRSKLNLEICDFEDTAREVLLYIEYIAKHDDEEFCRFSEFIQQVAGIAIDRNKYSKSPEIFGRSLEQHGLSPGQQYLLRMCVALFCNKLEHENFLLLLDEPETHLHPEAIWSIMQEIKKLFGQGQIWIATHSVALLSMFDPGSIWHVEAGERIKLVGSKSASLINGLVGDTIRRMELQKFVASPDWFACNSYAAECLVEPQSLPLKPGDPQVRCVAQTLSVESVESRSDGYKSVIVDYGAGKGRLLEGIASDFNELLKHVNYISYNKFTDDNDYCKSVMKKYNIDPETSYYNDIEAIIKDFGDNTDKVFLVNVLHEIHPTDWPDIFSNIKKLLREEGEVIIVELEEFTYGEKAYCDGGFLVIQDEALRLLNSGAPLVVCERSEEDARIMRYRVPRALLEGINRQKVLEIVERIGQIALKKVKEIRSGETSGDISQKGLKLAFWTQQYTDARIILDENGWTNDSGRIDKQMPKLLKGR